MQIELKWVVRRFLIILFLSAIFVPCAVVLFQETLIFPMLLVSAKADCPPDRQCELLALSDGTKLELWKKKAEPSGVLVADKAVALIFRGNGGTLAEFGFLQKWLAKAGVTAYLLDYPGHGKSTGWPSEERIYQYARETADVIMHREGIGADNLVLIGVSVGSGVAAYLASELQPALLIILEGYSGLTQLVKQNYNPLFRSLTPFLRFRFPTSEYISKLKKTSFLAIHGELDQVTPVSHLAHLVESYQGEGVTSSILIPGRDHTNLFNGLEPLFLSHTIALWIERRSSRPAVITNVEPLK